MRPGFIPGVNVDRLDIAAGLDAGTELGFDSANEEMVVEYALIRWARGEEAAAERMFLHYFPHDMTAWRRILATAIAAATQPALEATPPTIP